MKELRTAIVLAVSAFIMLGSFSSPVLAHHDDAKGSAIVYEGGGGR